MIKQSELNEFYNKLHQCIGNRRNLNLNESISFDDDDDDDNVTTGIKDEILTGVKMSYLVPSGAGKFLFFNCRKNPEVPGDYTVINNFNYNNDIIRKNINNDTSYCYIYMTPDDVYNKRQKIYAIIKPVYDKIIKGDIDNIIEYTAENLYGVINPHCPTITELRTVLAEYQEHQKYLERTLGYGQRLDIISNVWISNGHNDYNIVSVDQRDTNIFTITNVKRNRQYIKNTEAAILMLVAEIPVNIIVDNDMIQKIQL